MVQYVADGSQYYGSQYYMQMMQLYSTKQWPAEAREEARPPFARASRPKLTFSLTSVFQFTTNLLAVIRFFRLVSLERQSRAF
jgi:hypothetical protein